MWSSEATWAFQRLKQAFTSVPVLQHLDPERPFIVKVDALDTGVGAMLSQHFGDNKMQPSSILLMQAFADREDLWCGESWTARGTISSWTLAGRCEISFHCTHRPYEPRIPACCYETQSQASQTGIFFSPTLILTWVTNLVWGTLKPTHYPIFTPLTRRQVNLKQYYQTHVELMLLRRSSTRKLLTVSYMMYESSETPEQVNHLGSHLPSLWISWH